jgi:hypothetical protein
VEGNAELAQPERTPAARLSRRRRRHRQRNARLGLRSSRRRGRERRQEDGDGDERGAHGAHTSGTTAATTSASARRRLSLTVTALVVLSFGIAMTMNGDIPYDQFWIIFGLIAWALSAATGIFFISPLR